jgi:polyhydroxyalkanoate synthase
MRPPHKKGPGARPVKTRSRQTKESGRAARSEPADRPAALPAPDLPLRETKLASVKKPAPPAQIEARIASVSIEFERASPTEAATPPQVRVSMTRVAPDGAQEPTSPPLSTPPSPLSTPPSSPSSPPPSRPSPPLTTAEAPDPEVLSRNVARFFEEYGKVYAAFLKPREEGLPQQSVFSDEATEALKSIGQLAEHYLADPQRALRAQSEISTRFLDLWGCTLRRLAGERAEPVVALDPGDKRFADPEWRNNPVFDFMRQAHALTSEWALQLASNADGLDPHTRDKARFWIRQIAGALSPSNFPTTNPELLRETLKQNGDNLVRGMHLLAEDIQAGHGQLLIRQSDSSKFELGVNIAVTPGKVIYRNDLIELIQYAPATPEVLARPLLIVPPWINKYYVLDLNPEKSFIRFAVSQGLTVFVISWVNPDERHRNKGFEAYMREGIFEALDCVIAITGEPQVSALGYCVGGTLLAVTLAYMAQTGDRRINSATLFTTQVDFRDPGDLKVFIDEGQIEAIETQMAKTGFLDGSKMANAFNMLRPNDLIWSFVVNNYVKGKAPAAFDLLSWNSDSTRMTAANHSFYLRNFYLNNRLTKGTLELAGLTLDPRAVRLPIYCLATREDHIAPAKSVFIGAQYFGGDVRFVLAGSGHIAGVVNPPTKPKYQFWLGPHPSGQLETWLTEAVEHPGTWWNDWIAWITAQAPAKVTARIPGSGPYKALADAPGTYVKIRN